MSAITRTLNQLLILLTLSALTVAHANNSANSSANSSTSTADAEATVKKPLDIDNIPVCYDFGCKQKDRISLDLKQWQGVKGWFYPAAQTPVEEREQIKQAIGWMEVVAGQQTPTHRDIAFDLSKDPSNPAQFPGQQDCIDESVNTTNYLLLFQKKGLLRHHKVIKRAYRQGILDQHWAAQIVELKSQDRYVVDSWFQPNGYLPVIQDSASWHDINILSAVIDNRPVQDESRLSWWERFLRDGF